jgi:hypothetical protein
MRYSSNTAPAIFTQTRMLIFREIETTQKTERRNVYDSAHAHADVPSALQAEVPTELTQPFALPRHVEISPAAY